MANYEKLKTANDVAYALVEQQYCEGCDYNNDGVCMFVEVAKESNMYTACLVAAKKRLNTEAG